MVTRKVTGLAAAAMLSLALAAGGQARAGERIKVSHGHHAGAPRGRPASVPASVGHRRTDARTAASEQALNTSAPVYPPPAPGEPGGNDRGELSIARNYQYRTNDQKLKLCERRRIDASLGDPVSAQLVRQCRLGAYVATGKRQ